MSPTKKNQGQRFLSESPKKKRTKKKMRVSITHEKQQPTQHQINFALSTRLLNPDDSFSGKDLIRVAEEKMDSMRAPFRSAIAMFEQWSGDGWNTEGKPVYPQCPHGGMYAALDAIMKQLILLRDFLHFSELGLFMRLSIIDKKVGGFHSYFFYNMRSETALSKSQKDRLFRLTTKNGTLVNRETGQPLRGLCPHNTCNCASPSKMDVADFHSLVCMLTHEITHHEAADRLQEAHPGRDYLDEQRTECAVCRALYQLKGPCRSFVASVKIVVGAFLFLKPEYIALLKIVQEETNVWMDGLTNTSRHIAKMDKAIQEYVGSAFDRCFDAGETGRDEYIEHCSRDSYCHYFFLSTMNGADSKRRRSIMRVGNYSNKYSANVPNYFLRALMRTLLAADPLFGNGDSNSNGALLLPPSGEGEGDEECCGSTPPFEWARTTLKRSAFSAWCSHRDLSKKRRAAMRSVVRHRALRTAFNRWVRNNDGLLREFMSMDFENVLRSTWAEINKHLWNKRRCVAEEEWVDNRNWWVKYRMTKGAHAKRAKRAGSR